MGNRFRTRHLAGPLVAGLALANAPALAQTPLDSWSGYIDVRAAAANGDPSWLKGGFGKARYGGDAGGDWKGQFDLAEAAAVWHPRFSENFGAILHLQYEPGQDHAVDVIEGYLTYRNALDAPTKVSAKLGAFFPPVSLEHDEFAWTVNHTITPSAINTWVGEEIKVAGIEGTVRHEVGAGELSFTASAFGADDTAGTLLAFRGWALHDQEATVFGDFPIPGDPKRQVFFSFQDPFSKSMDEIDNRVGGYAGLKYRGDGFSLSALHFDNAGNRLALDGKQWGWATTFTNFGVSLDPMPGVTILSQYMTGETKSGWIMPEAGVPRIVIDAEFSSHYLLAAWDFGLAEIAARYDGFSVDDQSFIARDNENEEGRAYTVALSRQLSMHLLGKVEVMEIDSKRPQRVDAGLSAKDAQTVVQTSLRVDF